MHAVPGQAVGARASGSREIPPQRASMSALARAATFKFQQRSEASDLETGLIEKSAIVRNCALDGSQQCGHPCRDQHDAPHQESGRNELGRVRRDGAGRFP